jgi:hypothetical protein
MQSKLRRITLLLFVFGITASACGSAPANVAKQSTLDAISASVRQTSTAVAFQNQNPNASIETAQADATNQAQLALGTQGAQSELSAEAQAATASAEAPIRGELPKYGVDPSAGRVGWIHPPVSLSVEGFMQYDYVNYFISVLASDFVVSADITWDAIGSAAGCGFVLRSDGNERALDQYLALITRVASGHILFGTMAKGEVVTGQDIYAYNVDPAFDWQNNATNRFTVVGRGNRFFLYTNGTLIGEIDPSAPPKSPVLPPEPEKPVDTSNAEAMAAFLLKKAEHEGVVAQAQADFRARQKAFRDADKVFDRGFVAMVALSQSGRKATCQFDNAWLWLME